MSFPLPRNTSKRRAYAHRMASQFVKRLGHNLMIDRTQQGPRWQPTVTVKAPKGLGR